MLRASEFRGGSTIFVSLLCYFGFSVVGGFVLYVTNWLEVREG